MHKEISLTQLKTSTLNSRKHFDAEKLNELTASIKEKGLIEPIIVRPSNGKYEIVCGERRFRASQKAGLKDIAAIVKNLTDVEALEFQIIENLQREDLNAIEEAQGFQALFTKCKYTQAKLAKEIGKSQGYIAARLALLDLREDFQQDLILRKLLPGHVKFLMLCVGADKILDSIRKKLKDTKELGEQMTVRDFECIVDDSVNRGTKELARSSWGSGPEFDTKACKECKFNRSVKRWNGSEKRCFNPICWKEKQQVKLKAKRERIKDKIDKGQVVPDDQLKGVVNFEYNCKFDKNTCKKCDKRKVALVQDNYSKKKNQKEVCTDKECFNRKNKEAEEVQEKRRTEAFKKQVERVKAKAARAKMDRNFWALILSEKLFGSYFNSEDEAAIQAYQLKTEKLKTKKAALDYFTRNKGLNLEEIFRFITYWGD